MLMAVIAVGLLVSNPVFGWDLFTFGRKPIDWQRANSGILIERVLQGSPAEQIGLHVGDVIVGYNGTRVTDDHSIDAARSRALRQLFPSEVVLTVYPDGQCTPVKIKAPKGRLGIETNEWTYAGTFAYDALITKGNQQLAEQYVSDAERSGEYDENQMLHMKVMVVPNGTGAEESARRESIVEELYSKYPAAKLAFIAGKELQHQKRYTAAAAMFERYLKIEPKDVSRRLDLASVYASLFRWDDADRILSAVQQDEVSEYGAHVFSATKARVLLGQRKFAEAAEIFKREAAENPDDGHSHLAYLFTLVQSGDLRVFREARHNEEIQVPALSKRNEFHLDALESYMLAAEGRSQESVGLVQKWQGDPDANRNIQLFWRGMSDGEKIVKNWEAAKTK
jgi:tetratricopeptide (TPR) repeat protein